jgi:DNA/RNA-binding domain of Phe-tRNA-synthetase-like protein
MQFIVEPAIFDHFPGLRIAVAIAHNIDGAAARPDVSAVWHEAWHVAGRDGAQYGNAQSHPRVRPWREHFRALGVSTKDFPSSIEALLRRALKGGEPFTINPLVDWYNAVSLRHTVPVGGFDLADVGGPLELRFTHPGDTFLALDATAPVAVAPGEVAYADGPTVLTRHFMWRQARTALLTPATRDAFLVSEVPGAAGPILSETVLADLQTGLRDHFGVPTTGYIVDAAMSTIGW